MPGSEVQPRITRLRLSDFRSYASLDIAPDAPLVALCGPNGAGKTNILEAISLFTPGRGLRRATGAMIACRDGAGYDDSEDAIDAAAARGEAADGPRVRRAARLAAERAAHDGAPVALALDRPD